MSKISVVIPIYNASKYLRQCLESVVNQTLKDIEIICVNDGSTDNSLDIIKEFAENDSRIIIIDKKNTGLGAAYNSGLDIAKGEYIGFVEPDDFISLNMLEKLYDIAQKHDVDWVKSDFFKFSGTENPKIELAKLSTNEKLYNRIINLQKEYEPYLFIINTWCGIYNKNFIEKYNIRYNETDGASFQDTGFWFQTFCFAEKAYFYNEAFYMHRQDNINSSINSKSKIYCIKDEFCFIRRILEQQKKDFLFPIYQHAKYNRYMWNLFRLESVNKAEWLKVMQNEFSVAYKNGEINKNLINKRDYKNIKLLITNPAIFYRKILKFRIKK